LILLGAIPEGESLASGAVTHAANSSAQFNANSATIASSSSDINVDNLNNSNSNNTSSSSNNILGIRPHLFNDFVDFIM